jgi:hypothetical protein
MINKLQILMTTVPPSLRAQLPATRLPAVSIVWKGSETCKDKEEEEKKQN